MYGPSGMLARRGGGTAPRRTFHAPPINRPASTARLSMPGGAPRGRGDAVCNPSAASPLQVEESFTMVRENPLNFGMAIKLAPSLVEEIKRVEAEGGTARIKFGPNANNRDGNVIQVGDKTFRFTWSREPGGNCDIYEERQNGEGGNDLLIESGATWRKVNVERELDESTKNHVKKRSEEAERKFKSRKAIVLDHQTPSMKNQLKNLAVAETNPRRNFKHRKEPPFKKTKTEQPSGGPPKPVCKSGTRATSLSKAKLSSGLPLSSQLEQCGGSASPSVNGNFVKGHTGPPDAAVQNQNLVASSEKGAQSRLPNSAVCQKFIHSKNIQTKPTDLRSLIISLLLKHQLKGMNLKALEKAIGASMPNSARQLEPILKQVAIFQAPGKYFLKPGVEMESNKKPPPQSGSSPEISRLESPAPQKFDQLTGQDLSLSVTAAAKNEELAEFNHTQLQTVHTVEKIDMLGDSPELLSDKKVSDNGGELAGGSSDSGSDSDSDSDSSNSGSDSRSHSRSKNRTPVRRKSGSSSDSDSDATSSSKQESDEEVDIMVSDDDKESKQKLQDSYTVLSKSPLTLNNPDNEYADIGNHGALDHVSNVVDIVKYAPEDGRDGKRPSANYLVPNEHPSGHHEQEREDHDKKVNDGLDCVVNDAFVHGQPGTVERPLKGKSKRLIDDEHSDDRVQKRKKLKSQNLSQPVLGTISSLFGESPSNTCPDKPLDSEQFSQKSFVAHATTKLPSGERRPDKYENLGRRVKYSERSLQSNDDIQTQKGFNTQAPSKDGLVSADDLTRANLKSSPSLCQHNLSQGNRCDVESLQNKGPEITNKKRIAEAGTDQGARLDSYQDSLKKMSATQQDSDPIPCTANEDKECKLNKARDLNDRRRDASLMGHNGVERKRKESSLDVDSVPYTKYEKDEPDLKGPVKDVSQYGDYVKEYQEKYEIYSSLSKILESFRDEFSKLGKDLEACKGKDLKRYDETLKKMRLSFRQCGENHKRLKKIFVVLYKELTHLKEMIKEYATSYKKRVIAPPRVNECGIESESPPSPLKNTTQCI